MNSNDLKQRTKQFALRVIKLVESLPPSQSGRVIGNQLLRSGTSVGANYRSACRGRSKADFIAKVGIAIEEADETHYWLEILTEAGLVPEVRLAGLMQESDELVAILTATVITARKNKSKE
jgi:four helix bundle protein